MNIRPYTSTEDGLSPNNNLPSCLSTEGGWYLPSFDYQCVRTKKPRLLALFVAVVHSIQVKESVAASRYAVLVGLPASFTYTPTSGRIMYLQIELNHTDTDSFTTLHKTHFVPIIKSNVRMPHRDSAVGIATRYGLDDPWLESR
jgi:hypothetical protein